MRFHSLPSLLLAAVALMVFSVGCEKPETSTPPVATDGDHDGHDHDGHDHDGHDHADDHDDHAEDHAAHGPNGGHLFALDSDGVQAEWCKYKDNDIIRMYLLDATGKTAAAMNVDSFSVKPMVGNDETVFEMIAENPDSDGKASVFMLEDKDLTIAIPLGVTIEIKSGDKTITGSIKAHEPLDH